MASPGSERKKKKMTSWFALKRPKTTLKKNRPKKKVSPFLSNFFFRRIPELFFLCGHLANRFRLAEFGGVEPLRKLIRQKLVPGRGLKYAARPWSSGCCLGRMYTNHVCWSDRAPEVKQAWAPHERGIRLFTTLVDSRAKRGVGAKNTGYFFLAFFSRICSKNIHECATLYLVNETEFGNCDAGFVIPTPKLP